MTDQERLDVATKLMQATLMSPALGNLPGNKDEIIQNIKSIFTASIKEVVALVKVTRG